MRVTDFAYCENGECRVMVYLVQQVNDKQVENCPGCGRFGRLKDEA